MRSHKPAIQNRRVWGRFCAVQKANIRQRNCLPPPPMKTNNLAEKQFDALRKQRSYVYPLCGRTGVLNLKQGIFEQVRGQGHSPLSPAPPQQQRHQQKENGSGGDAHPFDMLHGRLPRLRRASDAFDLLAIASAQCIPADGANVLKHPHAVFQVAHAGALVVCPAHRNLHHAVAALDSDEQNLRIASPRWSAIEKRFARRHG